MFEGKLAGKHDRSLPSKPFCIVQTQWQVSGGLWLNVLLRLQIWFCPDGLISQKHRTVALEKAASGKSEINWEGKHLQATSRGNVVCPYQPQRPSRDETAAEPRLHPLLPKCMAQAARAKAVICSGASALHSTSSSLEAPRCLSSSRSDNRQESRARHPRAAPRTSSTRASEAQPAWPLATAAAAAPFVQSSS